MSSVKREQWHKSAAGAEINNEIEVDKHKTEFIKKCQKSVFLLVVAVGAVVFIHLDIFYVQELFKDF